MAPALRSLKKEEAIANSHLSSLSFESKQTSSQISTTLEHLEKAVSLYASSLCLTFDRATGQRLRQSFTHLDPKKPERVFTFTVNVDEEKYLKRSRRR